MFIHIKQITPKWRYHRFLRTLRNSLLLYQFLFPSVFFFYFFTFLFSFYSFFSFFYFFIFSFFHFFIFSFFPFFIFSFFLFFFFSFFLFFLGGLIAVPSSGFIYDQTHNWDVVFLLFAFHYIAGAFLWSLWASDQPLFSPIIPLKKSIDTVI